MPATVPPSRRWWTWIAAALSVAAILWSRTWCDAPLHRRIELGRAPIRLVDGATATVRFTPDHDGVFELSLHVPRAEIVGDGLDVLVAGRRSPDERKPAGVRMAYSIRRGGAVDVAGVTDDVLVQPSAGVPTYRLVYVVKGRPDAYEAEVRVQRAVAGLASAEAVVLAAASGDWILYRSVEAEVRRVLWLAGVVASAILWSIGLAIVARFERRRRGSGTGPPDVGRDPA